MTSKLSIFKIVDNVQIGHLYEHIFCMELVRYFRSHGLYSYIDYHIDAKTFYTGYVLIEIEFYSAEALKHFDKVADLNIKLSSDNINGGLLQIMAEKFVDADYIDDQQLLKRLQNYQKSPWQNVEKLPENVALPNSASVNPLVLRPRARWHFAKIAQTIELDKPFVKQSDQQTVAVFSLICDVLRSNLQEDIADNSYCFTLKDSFTNNKWAIKDTNIYRIDKRQATKLDSEIDVARALAADMVKNAAFKRINHKTINDNDISNVLKHTSIAFKLGKSHATIRLNDLI